MTHRLERFSAPAPPSASRRAGVVLLVYVVHAMTALALSFPVAKVLGSPTLVHPRGDLVLFDPGGLFLSEIVHHNRAALTNAIEGSYFAILLVGYLGLLPLAALLHALSHAGRLTLSGLLAASARFFGPLSLLLAFALLAAALSAFFPLAIGELVGDKVKAAMSDRGADLVLLGFRVLALAIAAIVGVVHDLARAWVVSRDVPALRAARLAIATFQAFPGRALGGWSVRGFFSLCLIAAGAWVTTRVPLESGVGFAAVVLLHQAIAFALIYLRADWLSLAIRLARQFETTPG